MIDDLPPPPWSVAGTIVDLARDDAKKTVSILVLDGCMEAMSDEQILELLTFCSVTKERLTEVLPPGWAVKG